METTDTLVGGKLGRLEVRRTVVPVLRCVSIIKLFSGQTERTALWVRPRICRRLRSRRRNGHPTVDLVIHDSEPLVCEGRDRTESLGPTPQTIPAGSP